MFHFSLVPFAERHGHILNTWNPSINKKKENAKKERYRKEGLELEQQGKYEEAYLKYEEAGKMDAIPSMLYIARMYLSGNIRPVETSNLAELMLQGLSLIHI